MTIYQPYVYIIRWTNANKGYIGVRYAKGCHPSDLFVSYHTSSKAVKQLISEIGLPDQVKIFPYSDKETALLMEEKFQRRFRVLESDYWFNKNINGKYFHNYNMTSEHKIKISNSMKGRKFSETHKQNISESKKGKGNPQCEVTKIKISETLSNRNLSQTHKQNISKARKGIRLSEETKKKMSVNNTGKTLSEETRNKISESMRNKHLNKGK